MGTYLATTIFGVVYGYKSYKSYDQDLNEDFLESKEDIDEMIYTEDNLKKFPEELLDKNIFVCSITLEILKDPVITKYGNTYEKNTILDWVAEHGNDPLTKQPLTFQDLRPNIAVKKAIKYIILKEMYNAHIENDRI